MTTMNVNIRQMAAYSSKPARTTRQVRERPEPSWDGDAPIEAMLGRFTLALMPFSLLAWMFVAW